MISIAAWSTGASRRTRLLIALAAFAFALGLPVVYANNAHAYTISYCGIPGGGTVNATSWCFASGGGVGYHTWDHNQVDYESFAGSFTLCSALKDEQAGGQTTAKDCHTPPFHDDCSFCTSWAHAHSDVCNYAVAFDAAVYNGDNSAHHVYGIADTAPCGG